MRYEVIYILYAGAQTVEANSEEEAREIVEGMGEEELMVGAQIDDIVQSVVALD